MSKEEIRKDIERHIRHCAMRHHVMQDEVIEVIKELVNEKSVEET